MLQKIQRTDFEDFVALIKGDISIARDEDADATLYKSDGQYVLIVAEPYHRSHWSRRKVKSDDEAMQRAQKILEKVGKDRGNQ